MRENRKGQEDFLDSKTFVAIGLLILSWLAWDHYMRKKYPESFKSRSQQTENQTGDQTSLHNSPPLSTQPTKPLKDHTVSKHKEKLLHFKGEKLDIYFTSQGFGIKDIELKSYYDRSKKPIRFKPLSGPLFSSTLYGFDPLPNPSSKSSPDPLFDPLPNPLPFQIKRGERKNVFLGEFSSKTLKVTKEIEVIEDQFLLKVKSQVNLSQEGLLNRGEPRLSLNFSHPIPPPSSSGGFFQKFFIYGEDSLKAFVHQKNGQSERFSLDRFEEEGPRYSLLTSAALGGKYFGKAFINKSEFIPSIHFKKEERPGRAGKTAGELLAHIDYSFLNAGQGPYSLEYEIFIGPKFLKNLQTLGGGLGKWPDFGFFSWMARPLLLFLNQIFQLCGNWGLSIIILTFCIRLCLLPINLKSYKSMKVMQKIQPEIRELKEIHKKDPKKMNQEIMALMKKHKTNPLAGCLPLFLQFPIVFALYRALGESIELYQSPFVLWIEDLSLKDPLYVLPLASGLIFFVQQLITPMNLPKEQAIMIKILPLMFSLFMLSLPSGLTLYIFVTSFFGLVQQIIFLKTGLSYFNKEGGKNA